MTGAVLIALALGLAAWAALLPKRSRRVPGPIDNASRMAAFESRLAASTEPTVRNAEETLRAARKGATVKRRLLRLDQPKAAAQRAAERRARVQPELFDPPAPPSNVYPLPKRRSAAP